MGEHLAPSLEGTEKNCKNFRGPNFPMTSFLIKMSILTPKISDDLFFSHRPYFVGLLYLFLDEKPVFQNTNFILHTFFSQFMLYHASKNTTSPNIEGTDAWAIPYLKL